MIVNDVSGGLADPHMAKIVAEAGCPWVLMHWRGHSREMAQLATYYDVVAEVRAELRDRVDAAIAAGVDESQHRGRPGPRLRQDRRAQLAAQRPPRPDHRAGVPGAVRREPQVLPGRAARGVQTAHPGPVDQREAATLATTVLAVDAGVWGVRVHEVGAHRRRDPGLGGHEGAPMSRPHHPRRPDGSRPPWRLRLRARSRPGVRRRRRPRARSRAGRRHRRRRRHRALRRAREPPGRRSSPAHRSI